MSVGISLPIPIPNPWEIKAQNDMRNDINERNRAQDALANAQWQRSEEWNWRKWNERHQQLQNLVKDAQKAGISPLAALGGGGHTPANINVPVGQGGRAVGNYQRQSTMEASISANLIQKSHLETLEQEEIIRGRRLDNAIKNLNYSQLYKQTQYYQDDDSLKLYEKAVNNYDEAVQWVNEGYIPTLNRELNFEMPESVGGYYFGKPHPEGWINP